MNNQEFTARLQIIMNEYDLTASAFAEKIGVGRSSISHLVSGRNKPSLEIILKILEEFPHVEFDWLVRGQGDFNAEKATLKKDSPNDTNPVHTTQKSSPEEESDITEENRASSAPLYPSEHATRSGGRLSKIVFFYEDGHFEIYKNN